MSSHSMVKAPSWSKMCAAVITVTAVILFYIFHPILAHAEGNVQMSTDYPGISANPGAKVTFDLDFANRGSEGTLVSLSQSDLPDGFKGAFEGNGSEISAVFVKTGDNDRLVTYNLTVPDDAKKGTYTITLTGNGSRLPITINVTDENTGSSQLSTDYAEQEGTSGTTFTFTTTIQNSSSQSQSYSLSSQTPKGWNVTFTSDSKQVASIDVNGHSSKPVTVTVKSPEKIDAGDYNIPVSAVSADQNLSAALKVTIKGTYNTVVTTTDGTLSCSVHSARRQAVQLNVVNNGNLDLNNLNLTTSAPANWKVEFSESTIDTLAAGQTKEVTMYITPSDNAVSGDYQMTVTAATADNSVDTAFRVTVKTSTAWGIIGVAIIAVVIAGLGWIFHKFGRH